MKTVYFRVYELLLTVPTMQKFEVMSDKCNVIGISVNRYCAQKCNAL